MSTLGIVIPTIGRIKYLDMLIESILHQNQPFDEIIIFDNSLEQNINQKSKYGNNNKIKFIYSGKQLDPINSWNRAVNSVNCDYVTIVGDDDILHPNYSSECFNIIQIGEVGLLKAQTIDENSTFKHNLVYPTKKILTNLEFMNLRFLSKISLFVPGIVFNKKLFQKVGGFKNTQMDGLAYADDLLLFKMVNITKKIVLSDEVCWSYRIHSGQIGVVKEIDNYLNRLEYYINEFEQSLIDLGVHQNTLYKNFSRNKYIERITKSEMKKYVKYSIKNINAYTYLKSICKNVLFEKQYDLKFRLKLFIIMIVNYVFKRF